MSLHLEYFYGNESEQFTFYRIPKLLITSPVFRKVSDSAKLLYGMMLDRMGLSILNKWFDDENRAYIYFTTNDVMEQMCCGTEKATKLLAELDCEKGVGLIERKKQGQGRPAIIYLKKFTIIDENNSDTGQKSRLSEIESQDFGKSKNKTFGNQKSRVSEIESADFRQSKCNNTNINNTDLNNTEQSDTDNNETDKNVCVHPSHPSYRNKAAQNFSIDKIENYEKYKEIIKKNIDYESLIVQEQQDIIDNIVDVMADVVTFPAESYYINQKNYPSELVKGVFLKINFCHISNMIMALDENQTKIRNIRSYLIAAIFNSYSTADAYLCQRVRYDMQNF